MMAIFISAKSITKEGFRMLLRVSLGYLMIALMSVQVPSAYADKVVAPLSEMKADVLTHSQRPLQPVLTSDELGSLLESLVWVHGGRFVMGSDSELASKMEGPAHEVTLSGFYLAKTEVTQTLFERVMGWNYSYFQCEDCAVNNISWMNVQLFLERLNTLSGKQFRLPTEAEWEYGAKGGQASKGYRFSGSDNIADVAWYAGNAARKSHPVGLKKPKELGLYDMTGNLWEFCFDDMSRKAYQREENHNPVVASASGNKVKSMKVIRGGGYEFSENESLVFKRDGATSNVRMADIGFRLAMSKD
jgi:formylglycine-generating enzyme required for sulfatase activity